MENDIYNPPKVDLEKVTYNSNEVATRVSRLEVRNVN